MSRIVESVFPKDGNGCVTFMHNDTVFHINVGPVTHDLNMVRVLTHDDSEIYYNEPTIVRTFKQLIRKLERKK